MITDLDKLLATCLSEISECTDSKKLESVKIAVLGKNGKITDMLKALKDTPIEERKEASSKINVVKNSILQKLEEKSVNIEILRLKKKLASEFIDISMPPRFSEMGTIHPLAKVEEEISEILSSYGFVCTEGPDIESEYFNFTALNMPDYHPARAMHDTFYVSVLAGKEGRRVMRTHTTPVQIHSMLENKPPFRFFTIGRVFRSDYDATHTPMFNQIEGILVEKDIGFAHLKWLLSGFVKKFFGVENLEIRLRPSFFPFTEPSAEIDINYKIVDGKIVFGSGDKWMEIGGAGMVHPNVLKYGNVDPKKFQGLAFGFGLERMASLKYGVPDLRGYFESDDLWRRSFGFDHFAR